MAESRAVTHDPIRKSPYQLDLYQLDGGDLASTGLVTISLRAQVPSHLVKQLGKPKLPTLTWLWLRKLRLSHLPAWQLA